MSNEIFEALRPYLNAILIGLLGSALAFIIGRSVSWILARLVGQVWGRFIGSFLALVVMILTVKLILDSTGAAGLLVVIVTAITGAAAIGSEQVVSDLLAGIGVLIGKTYREGDYVVIAGKEGRISNISLFLTTLETVNGDEIYIRNAEATHGTIVNYSAHPGHLISVKILLPVNQDLNVAVVSIQNQLKEFAPGAPNQKLHEPTVVVESAEDGYFIMEVRAYITERLDPGPEKTRLYLLAVNALKEAGLNLGGSE
ncbi:MAG: mechanosensitive ion channel [Anaerolineales bacterium]|nr:mechanosensitive ion channel [Anaerolineales bacterium]